MPEMLEILLLVPAFRMTLRITGHAQGKSFSEPRVLKGGMILKIKPIKVPRVIGKKSTMVKQISDSTKSQIVVGVNGVIWIQGGNAALAIEAILRIEEEAHVGGLTERIKLMLEKGGN